MILIPIKMKNDQNNSVNDELSTLTEKDFECQVCLDKFVNPVLMPCHAHSICLQCLYSIYIVKKKESRSESKRLQTECPTCGTYAGKIEFRRLKINKELVKIMASHAQEKKTKLIEKPTPKQEDTKLELSLTQSINEKLKNVVTFDALKLFINGGNVAKLFNMDLNITAKQSKHI